MSIELLPLAKKCNIACAYCYQQDERDVAGNQAPPYDLEAMKAALLAEGVGNGVKFSFFGGESLLFPINDLEHMLEWAASINAPAGIQTNGTILTDRHIELFKKYKVGIGVSIDGPDELNSARAAQDPKATIATTRLAIRNLERLITEGLNPSLIVTLTRQNASLQHLDRLIRWLLHLRDSGLNYLNLHTLEPHGDNWLQMPQDWQSAMMLHLKKELVGFKHVSPFDDMRKSLMQESGSHCTFNFCDPYTTASVRGIDGQGTRSNCGRTNRDGISYVKGDKAGFERYLSLYLTPMDQGGCGGCRFFLACGGGNCPGEAEGGDWRAKTVHCETLFSIFEQTERELFAEGKTPISMSIQRPLLEYQKLAGWAGITPLRSGDRPHGDIPHGDHTDAPAVQTA